MRTDLAVGVALGAGLLAVASIVPTPVVLVSLAGVLGAPWIRTWGSRVPWWPATLAVLGGAARLLSTGAEPRVVVAMVLLYLALQRCLSRTSPTDDRWAVFVAMWLLVCGAVPEQGASYGVAVLAWASAAPLAMMGASRGGTWLALAVPSLGVALFAAIPRAEGPQADVAVIGFTEQAHLGTVDALLADPTVVLRVDAPGLESGPLYLRGVALDDFDGQTWTASSPVLPHVSDPRSGAEQDQVFRVRADEPVEVLFTAGRPRSVEASGGVWRDDQGAYRAEQPVWSYTLSAGGPFGRGAVVAAAPSPTDRFRLLPEDTDPKVVSLSQELTRSAMEPGERLDALLVHMDGYRYSRRPEGSGAEAPLSDFLLDGRPGHCEYFASGLAVLARASGLSARVVHGFVTEEQDAGGTWIVRKHHAHAWVEALTERGWVLVDATPASVPVSVRSRTLGERIDGVWQAWVVEWSRQDQQAVVERVRGVPWRAAVGLALVVLGWAWIRWYRSRPPVTGSPVARLLWRAQARAARRGWEPPAHLPPLRQAEWLAMACPGEAADAFRQLAWLHYRVVYRGDDPRMLIAQATQLARAAMQIPRRRANDGP